jgi:hypothetical protein
VRPLGLWRDSRAIYAIGAFVAGVLGCVVIGSLVGGMFGYLAFIMGVFAGPLLVIAALVGFHMTSGNPGLHPVLRWLALCVLAWLVLSMITVIVGVDRFRTWLWITLPLAAIHGAWTALFLIGRKPSGR